MGSYRASIGVEGPGRIASPVGFDVESRHKETEASVNPEKENAKLTLTHVLCFYRHPKPLNPMTCYGLAPIRSETGGVEGQRLWVPNGS